MSHAHRQDDDRSCGAKTIVEGQTFVKVEDKLWAVEGDKNTHGEGALIATKTYIKIDGKSVIVENDNANQDNLCPTAGGEHCNPRATGFSSLIDVG